MTNNPNHTLDDTAHDAPRLLDGGVAVRRRNTTRGRPRTTGTGACDRCHRATNKIRITWPDGRICGICYHQAMRCHGPCTRCGQHRLLPGRDIDGGMLCGPCSHIDDLTCTRCGTEAEHYRKGICARCALSDDLATLLLTRPGDPAAMATLHTGMTAADRPESLLTWMRSPTVRDLLTRLGAGDIPLNHPGLDAEPASRAVEHLRALLEAHGLLPGRDHYLALFESWLTAKLARLSDPRIRQPVDQFARWHHLARIRRASRPGQASRGPVHTAKQEITEVIKFLTWLHTEHDRFLEQATQLDVEEYLAAGPTTRHLIRTFFVWRAHNHLPPAITIGFRQPSHEPLLTQDQRLTWIRRCLTNEDDTRTYRVAAILLLLFAQPLVRVAAMTVDQVQLTDDGPVLTLGRDPIPVPEPFATLLLEHLATRPNLRTTNTGGSQWLFPSTRGGRHLHPNTVMDRLRDLGIDLQAARSTALHELVANAPAPIVAEMLGYSYQVTERHTQHVATTYSRYASSNGRATDRHPQPVTHSNGWG